MTSQVEQPAFETALKQLEGHLKRLESGELSLEESMKCFEEGVRLTRLCQEHLSQAEQKVSKVMADGEIKPLKNE